MQAVLLIFSVYLAKCATGSPYLMRPGYDMDGIHPPPGPADHSQGKASIDWNAGAKQYLDKAKVNFPQIGTAKNVIIFLGDGLGPSTVTAARFYAAEQDGVHVSEKALSWEQFPNTGLSKTYNSDRMVGDSAGTATAVLCGEKVNFYTVGVNDNVLMSDCSNVAENKLKSALKHAMDAGKVTGVVTTARVTHATPAAAYASSADRNWEASTPPEAPGATECPDIAQQLVHDDYARNMRVFLGGGRGNFYPSNETIPDDNIPGWRTDGRNLVKEWLDDKADRGLTQSSYQYVSNKQEFDDINPDTTDFLFGMFSSSHMSYEVDRTKVAPPVEPSLTEMTEKAIRILQRSSVNGYVLFVEGARIDTAHHDNQPHRALAETVAMAAAVEKARELTEAADETLIVVTGDHGHAMSIAGYPLMTDSILGTHLDMQWEPADKIPYSNIGYLNGPGWYVHRLDDAGNLIQRNASGINTLISRKNLTEVDTAAEDYISDAGIPNDSETHSGEDVAVYSVGPSSYLFNGVYEQHYIAHAVMYASCIGPYKDNCDKPVAPPGNRAGKLKHSFASLTLIFLIFTILK